MSELGVEDGPAFLTMQQMLACCPSDEFPWTDGRIVNAEPPALPGLIALPSVSGITVNTVHGDDASIAAVTARYAPDVESMEGAAFMYACLVAGVAFAQVRAVSNRVERRNRDAWDLKGAVNELGRVALTLLGDQLMHLSLGFSPCPNDCFMFDAIVNRRIDLEGLSFTPHLADVEALNRETFAGTADITKLSYHAYAYCRKDYVLLDAGSALGRNCGPLLISARRLIA